MKLSLNETSLRGDLSQRFASADPLPLVVQDDFLPPEFVAGLMKEIQANTDFQKSNDYIFAKNKFESPRIEALGEYGAALRELMLSAEFAEAISKMYGKQIFVDPDFVGGGLHRGGEGSYLDMHTDFNLHPRHRNWIRELNILLYLNRDWQPEYGGELELRNSRDGRLGEVEPVFNRLVLMLTKYFTFHGYKAISFPPGTYRTSVATYAYSQASSEAELSGLRTTTTWAPETHESFFRACVAKITPALVSTKQRLFGSGTARKK